MGLIAHPIKSIPLLYLEASQFCLEKSNMDTLRLLPAEYPSLSTERSPLYSERWSWNFTEAKHHTVFPGCGSRHVATSCLWGMGTTPGAVGSCFPSGQGAWHCSATSALLQPMLEATKMVLVLEPDSGFQQTDASCCSLNTPPWVKAYIPIPALLFWEVCYKQLWPAQTENLEVTLLFTTWLSTAANKKCTSHIIIAISFSRYALSGSRAYYM